jgi:hypothetical protein
MDDLAALWPQAAEVGVARLRRDGDACLGGEWLLAGQDAVNGCHDETAPKANATRGLGVLVSDKRLRRAPPHPTVRP